MRQPCRYCADRHQGCHAECEKYKAWKAELDEARKADETRKMLDGFYATSVGKTIKQLNKNKK